MAAEFRPKQRKNKGPLGKNSLFLVYLKKTYFRTNLFEISGLTVNSPNLNSKIVVK